MVKKWYKSKTFWINIISLVGTVTLLEFGYEITPEMAVTFLGVINLMLRLITKEEIEW